jgi:drug/metabolite transporter (DMT)-like permease
VLLGVLGAVVAVPVVIQSTLDDHAGTVWQGRYSLPIAVGVPLVATFALSATERGRELTTRRFVWVVGVLLGLGHILAFAQNLRRYTKGATKDVWYFLHADWEPPLPALFLTVAYVVVAAAFVAWVLLVGRRRRRRSQTGASAARDEPRVRPTAPL